MVINNHTDNKKQVNKTKMQKGKPKTEEKERAQS